MELDAEFDYKTAWQLKLYSHGNCMHFEMLTHASDTSILSRAN